MLLPEVALSAKELDQGPAYFQLQHMLNTALTDEGRYPLKAKNLIVANLNLDAAPGIWNWMPSPDNRMVVASHPDGVHLHRPFSVGEDMYKYEGKMMYIDPAGGGKNGDETVCAVTYFLHGYVFLMEVMSLPGGYGTSTFEAIAKLSMKHMVNKIESEENFGKGAFAQMLRPVLLKTYKKAGHLGAPQVEDVMETGQKELRIIDTLEPILARHRLIIHEDVFHNDIAQVQKYPVDKRTTYTLWNQLTKITRDKGALIHDDRLDAVAGATRPWIERIAVDEHTRIEQKLTNEAVEFMNNWAEGGSQEQQSAVNQTKALPNRANGLTRSNALGRRSSARRRRR